MLDLHRFKIKSDNPWNMQFCFILFLIVFAAKGYLEESKRIGNTNLYMEDKHIAERSITLLNKWS